MHPYSLQQLFKDFFILQNKGLIRVDSPVMQALGGTENTISVDCLDTMQTYFSELVILDSL